MPKNILFNRKKPDAPQEIVIEPEHPSSPTNQLQNQPQTFKAIEKKNEEIQKIDSLIQDTQRIIYKVWSVFPFDFFQSTLIVDLRKVDIVRREFFGSERVESLDHSQIIDVIISTTPFMCSLTLVNKEFKTEPVVISKLWRKDAVRAKRIISGLVACKKENIDLSLLTDKEILTKVEEIGNTQGVRRNV